MHWRRKWQPTPVFLPGESQGRGSLVGCCLWGCTELDTTEVTQQQQGGVKGVEGQGVDNGTLLCWFPEYCRPHVPGSVDLYILVLISN